MNHESRSIQTTSARLQTGALLLLACLVAWTLLPIQRVGACVSTDDCPSCFCGGSKTCSGATTFTDGKCGCDPPDDCLSFCCSCEQLNDPTHTGCLPSQCEDSKDLLSTVGCALLCAGSNLLTDNECQLTVTRDQDCDGPNCEGVTGCCEFNFSISKAQEMGVIDELDIDESQLPILDDLRTCLQSDEGTCPTVFSQDLFNFVPGATCDPVEGACKLPLGEECTEDMMCLSGFCEQGVCCDMECDGPLQSCNLPGSEGMCVETAAKAPATSYGGLIFLLVVLGAVGAATLMRRQRRAS